MHASDLADHFHHNGNHTTKWEVTKTVGWKAEHNTYLLPSGEVFGQTEQPIDTFAQLEQTIHNYINYYNNKRIQVKLKGLSPVEYRTQSFN